MVITGSVVYNAGVNEKYRALAQEDILPHLILQVVVKAENAHTDWAQAIVDAYLFAAACSKRKGRTGMTLREKILDYADQQYPLYRRIALDLHARPETSNHEYFACKTLSALVYTIRSPVSQCCFP